jgi:hypothetical protein
MCVYDGQVIALHIILLPQPRSLPQSPFTLGDRLVKTTSGEISERGRVSCDNERYLIGKNCGREEYNKRVGLVGRRGRGESLC